MAEVKPSGDGSVLERVPADQRMAWPSIAGILAGIVSSLPSLMSGALVTFYAGFKLGMLAAAIAFVISFFFVYMIGKITYREGLPNNVVSRAYAFGTKGSAIGSIIWAFLMIGLLGMGSVQLGNGIIFYFGLPETLAVKLAIYIPMSILWAVLALFGEDIVAKINTWSVAALFILLGYMIVKMGMDSGLGDAFSFGIMIPGVTPVEGFSVALNTSIMFAGLMALFSADFTRFAEKESDLVPIALTGNIAMYVFTYICGALLAYFGFTETVAYFMSTGMNEAAASQAAIANPGVTLVLAGGVIGLIIIFFSQAKVQMGNTIAGSLALANLADAGFGAKLGWTAAVSLANLIGILFIFGGILDWVANFLTIGGILTASWATLMIVDYYLVRGKWGKGPQGIRSLEDIPSVNWRGVLALIIATGISTWLFMVGSLSIPFLAAVPLTAILYPLFSIGWRAQEI